MPHRDFRGPWRSMVGAAQPDAGGLRSMVRRPHALATPGGRLRRSGNRLRGPSTVGGVTRLDHPDSAVNDADWLRQIEVAVNARWLPPFTAITDVTTPRSWRWLVEMSPMWCVRCAGGRDRRGPGRLGQPLLGRVPTLPAEGKLLKYPWDLVEHNPGASPDATGSGSALQPDFAAAPADATILGPRERTAGPS